MILLSVSIIVAWLALWSELENRRISSLSASNLLSGLRKTTHLVRPRIGDAKIGLGYNACVDAVVDVFDLFEEANVENPSYGRDFEDLNNLDQLAMTFKLHFDQSAGGERAVGDEKTFTKLEGALNKCKHVKKLGGNAAIMASVLAEDFGFKNIWLGGQVGTELKKLLPKSIETIGLDSGHVEIDGSNFHIKQDELHLIMEYKKGSDWNGKGIPATRANRFIVSRDLSNAVLASLEPLNQVVISSEMDLLVVSGFHMMDAVEDVKFRSRRLDKIVSSLKSIPLETKIHLELASIGDPTLLYEIAHRILPLVDSLGLNEQEIGTLAKALDLNLSKALLSRVTKTIPNLSSVGEVMYEIMSKMMKVNKKENMKRKFQRIHFHSFSFHVISQIPNNKWPNMVSAVAAGSVKASERACNTTILDDTMISLQMPKKVLLKPGLEVNLSTKNPVIEWSQGLVQFALAPVLTCNRPLQTVGLGDSISASAIAYQV